MQLYPDATAEERRAASHVLTAKQPYSQFDTVDAAWIACGTGTPADWHPGTMALLPPTVDGMKVEHLEQGLELKFQRDTPALEDAFAKVFPGQSTEDCQEAVKFFKDNLTRTELQKGCHFLLGKPDAPEGLTLEALLHDREVMRNLKEFLSNNQSMA